MPSSAPPAPKSPAAQLDALRLRADALFRCATECGRQHERIVRLKDTELTPTEQRIQGAVVALCHEALTEVVADYEKCGARLHPTGDDEAWWHKANAVWLASRAYLRRSRLSELVGRRASDQNAARFGELQMDYELEASALLALQQTLAAYKKVRPEVE